jgi:hypothetical protein
MLMMALIISGLTGNLFAQNENKEVKIKLRVEDAGNGEVIILDTTFTGDDQEIRMHTLKDIRIEKVDGEMRFEIETLVDSVLDSFQWTEESKDHSTEHKEVIIRKSDEGEKSIIIIRTKQASLLKMDKEELASYADLLEEVGVSGKQEPDFPIMEFYPNPSDGLFNLDLHAPGKGAVQVEVFNLDGKRIFAEKKLQSEGKVQTQIDLRGHPAGTYLLVLRQGKDSLSRKIVLH